MNLPWEVVDACNGFSVDIGGSGMKLLYIDKNDWKEPDQREKNSKGNFRVKMFPHESFDSTEAFDFINKMVYLKKKADSPVIYGTGFGASVLTKKFSQEVGVIVQCEDEISSFAYALAYLAKHSPRKEILRTFDHKEVESFYSQGNTAYQTASSMRGRMTTSSKINCASPDDLIALQKLVNASPDKPLVDEKNMFPCMIVMCGSGTGCLLVAEDGSCELLSMTPFGGKFWSGIGNILTDAQNYPDLMGLAETGNHANVDLVIADIMPTTKVETSEDFYQEVLAHSDKENVRTIFSFAKVKQETKGDMKQEDLARSMLHALAINMTQVGLSSARLIQARHVFFVGGFVSHPLVQKMIYQQWILTWCDMAGFSSRIDPIAVHFLQQGSYLGALGALLKNLKG